jgi:hypothetical protein
LSSEEEERLSNLEKRLVPNVEFDDQALYTLGFGTDIYYMLGHLGWVQFSNGVSVDTHLGFALEILMTIAPILDDDGVQSLSFRLEVQVERKKPSRTDVRAGDSLCLEQDTTLLPRLWTSRSLVKLKLSTSNLPKSRK